MITCDDYRKFLFPYNFIGGVDGTLTVPGQTVHMAGVDHIITYSFFTSQSDIISAGYYDPQSEEVLKFINSSDYQQNIEDMLRFIFSSSSYIPSSGQYMWFQDVAQITFSESPIGTNDTDGSGSIDSPDEYTAGHITIGQLNDSYSNFYNSSGGTASAVTHLYNPNDPNQTYSALVQGDIFINSDQIFWDSPVNVLGSQQLKVFLEETLHALGADSKIPGVEGTYLDNQKYTVAAYANDYAPGMFSNLGFSVVVIAPHTLQIMDIAALQAIYGRNYTKLGGNTDFTLSIMNPHADDSAFLYTIWDGGGNDTIDVSDSNTRAEIDLRQGRFSSIGNTATGLSEIAKDDDASASDPDPGNVAIAFHAVIENAKGTNVYGQYPHGDVLIGNDWKNELKGLAGDDKLYGDGFVYDGDHGFKDVDQDNPDGPAPASDDDTLDPGRGSDEAYGGVGNDTFKAIGDSGGLEGDLYHGGG